MKLQNPIILFDGVCNLCNRTVDFLLKRDTKNQFRFASLQSEIGTKLCLDFEIPNDTDSVVLLNDNKVYLESDAALEIARLLSFPWKLALVFKIIPKKLRDKMYRWIAKNRYRWFGKRNTCRIPTVNEKQFFL